MGLSGDFVLRADGAVRVATSAGEFDIAANPVKALAKGDKATFVVSDDRVQLSNEKPAGGINAVRASVVGEEFVGATAVIRWQEHKAGLEG